MLGLTLTLDCYERDEYILAGKYTSEIPKQHLDYLGNSVSLKIDDAGNTQLDTSKHCDDFKNIVVKRRCREVL